jgi:uncharacterized protein (DUF1499 family)
VQPYQDHFPATQKRLFPNFGPLIIPGQVDDVWETVKRVISNHSTENRWEIKLLDEKERFIEFTATTRLWKFVDDVKVVVSQQDSGNVRIDARSKSRLGQGDFNANHKRLQYLFDLIKAGVSKQG